MYTLIANRKREKPFSIRITDYDVTDDTHLIVHRYFNPTIDFPLEEFQLLSIIAYPMASKNDVIFLWAEDEIKRDIRDTQHLHRF